MPEPSRNVRSIASLEELAEAEKLLADTFPDHGPGWRGRDFFRERFPEDAALMVVAVAPAGQIVGTALAHQDGDGVTLAGLGVKPSERGRGLGAALLGRVEHSARLRGAKAVRLGSVDEAAGFYLGRGYTAKLLAQFMPPQDDVEGAVARAMAGPLAGLPCVRGEFRGVAQLFVQVPAVDFALAKRLEAEFPGCVAGHMMSKQLGPGGG